IEEELRKAEAIVAQGTPPERVYMKIFAQALEPRRSKDDGPTEADPVVDVAIDGAPIRGTSRAPVTIVLFSDFECPYCVKAENTLRSLEAANPGKVRVAFRHRPLPMHEHAKLAAKASMAAERQGRFWEYHDVLVAHREALQRADLERYASDV